MRSSWRCVVVCVLAGLADSPSWAGPPGAVESCAPMCSAPCCDWSECSGPRCYGSVEALLWWLKGDEVPPLVTSDDIAGPAVIPGALDSPTVRVLLAGDIDTGVHGGARVTLGGWLDNQRSLAVEGSYFFLAERSRSSAFLSDGAPVLTTPAFFQPFFNPTVGQEDALFVAGPANAGGIVVDFSQRLMGAELNGRVRGSETNRLRVDLLAGFRFLALDESLDTATSTTDQISFSRQTFESFATRNRFYGGQVGADARYTGGFWWVSGLIKLAIGGSQQQTDISGNTLETDLIGGIVTSTPQTLFAQATNSGEHDRCKFVFVPELTLTFGLRLLDNVDLTVGYTLIWMSNVVRPGSAIDRNSTGPPPFTIPPPPVFTFHGEDFWAQGINLGVALRY